MELPGRCIEGLSTGVVMIVVVSTQLLVVPGNAQTKDPVLGRPIYSFVSILLELCERLELAAVSSPPAVGSY